HTRFSRDWSSDVCSSDLGETSTRIVQPYLVQAQQAMVEFPLTDPHGRIGGAIDREVAQSRQPEPAAEIGRGHWHEVGRVQLQIRSEERRVGEEGRSAAGR